MNKPFPTPIRDGDWHIVDGELVDMREQRKTEAAPPAPINDHDHHTDDQAPQRGRRRKR